MSRMAEKCYPYVPRPMKEGAVWFNFRDKNYYIKKNGKLVFFKKGQGEENDNK